MVIALCTMEVSLQKVAGLSVGLKVALSNKNSGKIGQNSGKQSISINGSALCGLILQQFTLLRDAPMVVGQQLPWVSNFQEISKCSEFDLKCTQH